MTNYADKEVANCNNATLTKPPQLFSQHGVETKTASNDTYFFIKLCATVLQFKEYKRTYTLLQYHRERMCVWTLWTYLIANTLIDADVRSDVTGRGGGDS